MIKEASVMGDSARYDSVRYVVAWTNPDGTGGRQLMVGLHAVRVIAQERIDAGGSVTVNVFQTGQRVPLHTPNLDKINEIRHYLLAHANTRSDAVRTVLADITKIVEEP